MTIVVAYADTPPGHAAAIWPIPATPSCRWPSGGTPAW